MGLYDDEINAEREAELDRAKRAIVHLQEQMETLRKERDANHHMAVANGQRAKDEHYRIEALEARLAEAMEVLREIGNTVEYYDGTGLLQYRPKLSAEQAQSLAFRATRRLVEKEDGRG